MYVIMVASTITPTMDPIITPFWLRVRLFQKAVPSVLSLFNRSFIMYPPVLVNTYDMRKVYVLNIHSHDFLICINDFIANFYRSIQCNTSLLSSNHDVM